MRQARATLAPVVLIAVTGLALAGLAVLPDSAASPSVLVSAPEVPPQLGAGRSLDRPSWSRPLLSADRQRTGPLRKSSRSANASTPRPARASRRKQAWPTPGAGYLCPVAGSRRFVDSWGDPRSGGRRHQGTDILAAYGTPLVAVTTGFVRTAYSSAGGISLYLLGTDGVEYFYAHNSRNAISSGRRVSAGEIIGYVGNSGNASGGVSHVHFERHPGRAGAVNPYPFVARAC